LEDKVGLSSGDLERLVKEMSPIAKNLRVRSIWCENDDHYGFYLLSEDSGADKRLRFVMNMSLASDTGRLTLCPAGSVDKKVLKARQKQSGHVLNQLRKHLVEALLVKVEQVENERIVLLDFDARRDDGLETINKPRLAVELTGRRTNLALMNEQNMILVVHRHGRGQGGRDLVAKEAYTVPEFRGQSQSSTELTDDPYEGVLGLNRKVSDFLTDREEEALNQSYKGRIAKAARKGLKRLVSRLKKLERELDQVDKADELQRHGELIKIYANRIPKGATSFKALDEFESPAVEREIKLEGQKKPLDQAALLFKRAKKLRRGRIAIEMRLGQSEADGEDVRQLLEQLTAAADDDDEKELARIEQKLKTLGCGLPPELKSKARIQENQGPRQFSSQDGLTILVGRSNSENDKLSLQIARGNDLFFHVRGCPGSHVVVRKAREKSVPLETLLDAATLAIHYSKMRGNGRAEVSYTPCKYVSKPKGAKPGLVRISNERTLRPGGDPDRLKRLLASLQQKED
jgi:predicted ribosome quality control (RQC) complex YloA/Tae2 family protein